MKDKRTKRLCPMMALLSEGEDSCIGDGCMWFVKLNHVSTGEQTRCCAVALGQSNFNGRFVLDLNPPEMV